MALAQAASVAATKRAPRDRFGVRLAIIRAEMGWNCAQAGAACGIDGENWRLWEKGPRQPQKYESACRKVAAGSGYPVEWIASGGPLEPSETPQVISNPLPVQRTLPFERHLSTA